jgi:hypothetical protein
MNGNALTYRSAFANLQYGIFSGIGKGWRILPHRGELINTDSGADHTWAFNHDVRLELNVVAKDHIRPHNTVRADLHTVS